MLIKKKTLFFARPLLSSAESCLLRCFSILGDLLFCSLTACGAESAVKHPNWAQPPLTMTLTFLNSAKVRGEAILHMTAVLVSDKWCSINGKKVYMLEEYQH